MWFQKMIVNLFNKLLYFFGFQIHEESSYNEKTAIVREFLKKGKSGKKFEGDTYLWVKFLLPMVNKRIYNLQSKQLCKLFARYVSITASWVLTDTRCERFQIFTEQESFSSRKYISTTVRQRYVQAISYIRHEFCRIFGGSIYEAMVSHLESGDVAETIAEFHENSQKCPPLKSAALSLQQVDRSVQCVASGIPSNVSKAFARLERVSFTIS